MILAKTENLATNRTYDSLFRMAEGQAKLNLSEVIGYFAEPSSFETNLPLAEKMVKTFINVNTTSLLVSEGYYDTGSIDGFLQELDREKAKVVITKEFRKFRKPTIVIKGLESMTDVASITKELKIKLGAGGTYKNGLVILQGDHRSAAKHFLITKGIKEDLIEVR